VSTSKTKILARQNEDKKK